MIRDRRRIANKLKRISNHILNMPNCGRDSVEEHRSRYEAIAIITRLRGEALFDTQWKWEGFASEVEWAREQTEWICCEYCGKQKSDVCERPDGYEQDVHNDKDAMHVACDACDQENNRDI